MGFICFMKRFQFIETGEELLYASYLYSCTDTLVYDFSHIYEDKDPIQWHDFKLSVTITSIYELKYL